MTSTTTVDTFAYGKQFDSIDPNFVNLTALAVHDLTDRSFPDAYSAFLVLYHHPTREYGSFIVHIVVDVPNEGFILYHGSYCETLEQGIDAFRKRRAEHGTSE